MEREPRAKPLFVAVIYLFTCFSSAVETYLVFSLSSRCFLVSFFISFIYLFLCMWSQIVIKTPSPTVTREN